MSSSELKENLHKRIDELSDHQIEKAYGGLVNFLNQQTAEGWSDISDEDKVAIEKGLDQIQKGQTLSHEQAMSNLRKSLKR